MQLLVIVLNKTEVLSRLLAAFMEAGISGATVAETKGMLNAIDDDNIELPPLFHSLRSFLKLDEEYNRTIFTVIDDEQVETASKIANEITGGLEKPNTGILFTLPINHIEGIPNHKKGDVKKVQTAKRQIF